LEQLVIVHYHLKLSRVYGGIICKHSFSYEIKLLISVFFLSALTWFGSDPSFRIDSNSISAIPFEFPGAVNSWALVGNKKNVQIDEEGVAILSAEPQKSRAYRDILIHEPEGFFLLPELLLIEACIKPLNIDVAPMISDISSRFHVRQLNSVDGSKFRFSAITLLVKNTSIFNGTTHEGKRGFTSDDICVEAVTRQVARADSLRVSMVLHGSGAWKLVNLALFEARLASHYLLFIVLVVLLWLWVVLRIGSALRSSLVN